MGGGDDEDNGKPLTGATLERYSMLSLLDALNTEHMHPRAFWSSSTLKLTF